MLESRSPRQLGPGPSVRTLKIEEDGDPFKGGIKPKIRLVGQWLERAGFKPGTRVSVRCLGCGVIELRAESGELKDLEHASSNELDCPFR